MVDRMRANFFESLHRCVCLLEHFFIVIARAFFFTCHWCDVFLLVLTLRSMTFFLCNQFVDEYIWNDKGCIADFFKPYVFV